MIKIKIDYYLNKNLKPMNYGIKNENFYPVYVRLQIGREVFRFRSPEFNNSDFIFGYQSDYTFNKLEIKERIENETNIINFVALNKNGLQISIVDYIYILKNDIISLVDISNAISYYTFLEYKENDTYEILNNEFCKFLEDKTKIKSNFFKQQNLLNNIRNYVYLKDEINDIIPENNIKNKFLLSQQIALFEQKFYSTKRKLNIYEWVFNNGKEGFLKFIENKEINVLAKYEFIKDIDFQCDIRLNPKEIE